MTQRQEADKISVIMGIYNCADTLPRAIDSILAQTYTNWELIMCDDGSTDNTLEVANNYKEKYPDKIIIIQNEKNIRLAATLNHCLEYTSGEYVARMDGDDTSTPDRFELQVSFLKSHPNIDLVGGLVAREFEGNTFVIHPIAHPDRYSLHYGTPFLHASIMTYKYVFDKVGGYTVAERTRRSEDWDLWFKFFASGFQGDNIDKVIYTVYEDDLHISRRRASDRWQSFKTTRIGYKALEYPKHWIIKPFIETCVRSFTPHWLLKQYKFYQHSQQ